MTITCVCVWGGGGGGEIAEFGSGHLVPLLVHYGCLGVYYLGFWLVWGILCFKQYLAYTNILYSFQE